MRDPGMGLKILELVILDILFGIADQFKDQEISSVRKDEGALVAERGVVRVIEPVGISIDEFIFEIARRKAFKSGLLRQRISKHQVLRAPHTGAHPAGGPRVRGYRDSRQYEAAA